MTDLPDLEVAGGAWYARVPPIAVPVPAAHVADLHGAHAIIRAPGGAGVLYGLRAIGSPRRTSAGLLLDVVPELDWWRSQIVAGAILTPRSVPLADVWIERRLPQQPADTEQHQEQPEQRSPGTAAALLRRLAPGPGAPTPRTPVPARTVPELHGRRIIQITPERPLWDLRAISEPYQTPDGEITANLTSTRDYHRAVLLGEPAAVVPVPLYLLWVE
ncbi:hypothetical protein [Streptomyces harbinensis]|uniref:Uncharacterized protein n=1 Tax=Streptomyces harbinensis TaxID=1176198 RepID=A0A1I6WDM0_9ACTN|nr:hypothetical protein [Streptomyces harbinensis]SFT24079.1 hypothetical protein SAMN05444716_1235 [Streptomyces harbinensis]